MILLSFYEFELAAFQKDDDTETNVTVHAPSMSLIITNTMMKMMRMQIQEKMMRRRNHKRISFLPSYWNNCSDSDDEYGAKRSFRSSLVKSHLCII